ncbi:MAG: NrfD/PsrC family molybdoenzyme membrane anchor subunit [Bacteroidales bacterium]|jgi:formate-dependent nitrite reductase membrane component NrfD|nr:NrfD/PsrC family molybdoenzyme membrane anchor subunit [Bacteroidales bacterium]
MKEELFVSGRAIPNIDPYLNIWHWQIPVYLFLGGLAAGLLFFAALYTLLGKEKQMPTAVKWATFLVPPALVLGLLSLFLDLKHKMFFWQLYTVIRLESPMSWGAWTLLIITPISILWSMMFLRELLEAWKGKDGKPAPMAVWSLKFLEKNQWIEQFIQWLVKYRKVLAWLMIYYGLILGIYTGILLSAFNARPLWNTSLLGPLFLVSGLSTAAATIMWMSKDHLERSTISRIDLMLIGIELFLIVHLFMGFLASSAVQIEAASLFLGGPYTVMFWVFVVFMGLILPAILETLELLGYKIPVMIPAILILFGGLVFRFVMVEAGQITRYLY